MSPQRPQKREGISEEAREELLQKIDEAVDETPKGKLLKETVEGLPSAGPDED